MSSITIHKNIRSAKVIVLVFMMTITIQASARQKVRCGADKTGLRCGADRTELYFPLLEGKRFALAVNQTSIISTTDQTSEADTTVQTSHTGHTHLADSLCAAGLRPSFIFSPEHGFRGDADAGASVSASKDAKTGLDIISLYGKQKKPTKEQLLGIDLIVFDLQDTGCRFYTYLSTLHYIIEACAENGVGLIILDRPNPNDTVDGPVRQEGFRSFVGMHPIPVLHGCTLGEMARMISGEHWVSGTCDIKVIPVEGWSHGQSYDLPIAPSPNLPNPHAINLYPSLCLFEGTIVSVGRGTASPFEVIGCPDKNYGDFTFTPLPTKGASHPLHEGKCCYGTDLRGKVPPTGFSISYLLEMFRRGGSRESFFSNARFFDLLSGGDTLRLQMLEGLSQDVIRDSWQDGLERYKAIRQKYLIY